MRARTCCCRQVEVRGQLSGGVSSLPTIGSGDGMQIWRPVPFSVEPSCQPLTFIFLRAKILLSCLLSTYKVLTFLVKLEDSRAGPVSSDIRPWAEQPPSTCRRWPKEDELEEPEADDPSHRGGHFFGCKHSPAVSGINMSTASWSRLWNEALLPGLPAASAAAGKQWPGLAMRAPAANQAAGLCGSGFVPWQCGQAAHGTIG